MARAVFSAVRLAIVGGTEQGIEPARASGKRGIEPPQHALDDEQIAALEPRNRVYKIACGRGLYLWVMPGGSKLWRYRYRLREDGTVKPREFAIGRFGVGAGELTLAAARSAAQEARDLVAKKIDPVQQRQRDELDREAAARALAAEQRARETSFGDVAEDWFKKKAGKWSPSHVAAQRKRLDTEIMPALGRCRIEVVDAPLILKTLGAIERRGAHETLAKVRAMIGQIFKFAVQTGCARIDPVPSLRGVFEKPPAVNRATIPLSDFPELFKALAEVPAETATKLALYWVMATGCRSDEGRFAQWSEIERGEVVVSDDEPPRKITLWRLPKMRMKMRRPFVQPLSPLAVAIIERARALRTSTDAGALLFPGFTRAGHLSENALLALLARAGFYGRQTTHGFRAALASWGHERGYDPLAVELCLAHRPGGVLGIYNRAEYLGQRLKILTAWGARLTECGLTLP